MSIVMPGITLGQDTLICQNGGFEDEFRYYYGFNSAFTTGSTTCAPMIGGQASVFSAANPFPENHRFQIVPLFVDPITGYLSVRFGEHSALLNHDLSHHEDDECNPDFEINKLVKRFKVTAQNRSITVWFCSVLQNPGGHNGGNQPFFSIKCDLAPDYNLCYDGISIPSNSFSVNYNCTYPEFVMKSTDWACHRINIPENKIGQIATIEFMAADCGAGAHFGYAYVDGICEVCDGGSYGSGTFNPFTDIIGSCDGDSITIKGRYTLPTISGYNILDNITVPGFNTYGMSINTTTKTFSFKIVKSDFQSPNPTCRDLIVYLQFKNSAGNFLPDIPTNALDICESLFTIPDLDLTVGSCNRNHPTNNIISDDYYFVNISITDANNIHWVLQRRLDDPLPDESGLYNLQTGMGNGNYKLGPFLIQDGSWDLILLYNGCSKIVHISPPDYCSGCPQLSKVKISNIHCDPNNGWWSYDIMVPFSNPPVDACWKLSNGIPRQFNQNYTISVGPVNQFCINREIRYYPDCNDPNYLYNFSIDICPPKPCNGTNYEDCSLEAYLTEINCIDIGNGNFSYTVEFNVSGAPNPCYRSFGPGGTNLMTGSFSNPLGPFTDDETTIIIYSCGLTLPITCDCITTTGCYKVFKVRKPADCLTRESFGGTTSRSNYEPILELQVIPNPLISDEFILRSSQKSTKFEIYNSSGVNVFNGSFKGADYKISLSLTSGLYLIRYKDDFGESKVVKFIKQ